MKVNIRKVFNYEMKMKFFHITYAIQTATMKLNDTQNLLFDVGRGREKKE
jgi:hypothetical protein